jgi:hypothetical protein
MKIGASVQPIFVLHFRTYRKFGPVVYISLFAWVKFNTEGVNNNLSSASFIKFGAVNAVFYVRP